jgi:threonyl-tRNA synthetase
MAGKHNHDGGDEILHKLRHSAAHVMAEAVLQLFPQAKIAIGPAIDTGFYYDFDLGKDEHGRPRTFTPEDLAEIEKRMRQIVGGQAPVPISPGDGRRGAAVVPGPAVQAGADRGLMKGGLDEVWQRGAGSSSDQHVPARHVRGLCAAVRTWSTRGRFRPMLLN